MIIWGAARSIFVGNALVLVYINSYFEFGKVPIFATFVLSVVSLGFFSRRKEFCLCVYTTGRYLAVNSLSNFSYVSGMQSQLSLREVSGIYTPFMKCILEIAIAHIYKSLSSVSVTVDHGVLKSLPWQIERSNLEKCCDCNLIFNQFLCTVFLCNLINFCNIVIRTPSKSDGEEFLSVSIFKIILDLEMLSTSHLTLQRSWSVISIDRSLYSLLY